MVLGKKPSHRPRKKGAKLPAPQAVVAATVQRKKLNVSWYGGGRRNVEVVSRTGQWYKSGAALIPILWVFVHDLTGTHRDTYLFTTDLSMTVPRIIETYTGRWNIETTFQERSRVPAVYFRVAGANNSIVRDARVLLASHWSRWRPTMRPYSMDLRERVARRSTQERAPASSRQTVPRQCLVRHPIGPEASGRRHPGPQTPRRRAAAGSRLTPNEYDWRCGSPSTPMPP